MGDIVRVVGAVIVRDGLVLAARRAPGRLAGRMWEFPGGKTGPSEPPRVALAREIAEELGIAVDVGELIDRSQTALDGSPGATVIDLACYWARLRGPAPATSTDHDLLAWLAPGDLPSLAWSAPDWPAVHAVIAALGEPG